jgi:predicted small metal-binding protein
MKIAVKPIVEIFLGPIYPQKSVLNSAKIQEGKAMAKELRCADVVGSCNFVARGDSEQEILDQAAEHARSEHGVTEITPELAEKVRSAIRDEAA